jgi:hypothetical protein
MIDRYTKISLMAISVFFMLASQAPRASAFDCKARTCTEAFERCMGIGCHEYGGAGGRCFANCSAWRETCMRTGEYNGNICQFHGLIKK